MKTIILIILGFGVVCGFLAMVASNKSNPKERAAEAAGAALGGAASAAGCVFQLVLCGIAAIVGIAILSFLFGH